MTEKAALFQELQEEDLYIIYEDLMREYGAITFEAFINLLVGITEDQMSLDQLREAFQGVAGDKVRAYPAVLYTHG